MSKCPECGSGVRSHFCEPGLVESWHQPDPAPEPQPKMHRWNVTGTIVDALNSRLPVNPNMVHACIHHPDSYEWYESDDYDHTNTLEYRLPAPYPSMTDKENEAHWEAFWFGTIKDFLTEYAPLEPYQIDVFSRIHCATITENCPCDQCKGAYAHFSFRLSVAKLVTIEEVRAAEAAEVAFEKAAEAVAEAAEIN